MNICWNAEESRFTDSAKYFKLVSDELGLDTFVNNRDPDPQADIMFNCESTPHFARGRKLTFIYHIDPTWSHEGNISERIDECDAIFSTHMDVPYRLDPKFVFLPHASHSTWFRPVAKEYDVFLPPSPLGPYAERRELSEQLASKFNTHTVGYGTPTREYLRQMNKCKIIFNQSGHGDVNRKIFDGMLRGCLVTNYLPGLSNIGDQYDHYFITDDPVEEIGRLLDMPDQISLTTGQSMLHVLRNHTYHRRLLTILSTISKLGG